MAKQGKSNKNNIIPKTEFQVHVTVMAEQGDYDISSIVDFTERRLILLAKNTRSLKVKNKVLALLQSYQAGDVAVAWSEGQPVYHSIDRRQIASSTDVEDAESR